jgi:paraquat-inducible protein B
MHSFKLFQDEDAADEKYVKVHFLMQKEHTLKAGSKIIYKTITVGHVKEVFLNNDNLEINALIDEEYAYLLKSDSLFWVEDISIDIDEIQNPSALLTGAFIKILKGRSDLKEKEFTLLNEAPVKTINQEGLRIILTGSRLSSLEKGSPIFYRQIKIGSIEDFSLSADSNGVDMKIFINKKYKYLVRENSIFYNATVMGMDISLFGVKISTETISTMIKGGITMVIPEDLKNEAKDLQKFKLYNEPEEDWLEYKPNLVNNLRQ